MNLSPFLKHIGIKMTISNGVPDVVIEVLEMHSKAPSEEYLLGSFESLNYRSCKSDFKNSPIWNLPNLKSVIFNLEFI